MTCMYVCRLTTFALFKLADTAFKFILATLTLGLFLCEICVTSIFLKILYALGDN